MRSSWIRVLGADPRPWLLKSEEPAARWITLAQLATDPAPEALIVAAHTDVLDDSSTADLIERLPDWELPQKLSGHASPAFAPNLLNLLADMGVSVRENPRIETLLDQMEANTIKGDRFATNATSRVTPNGAWSSMPCDHHAISEVLIRFGRSSHPVVRRALDRISEDLSDTSQGTAWLCIPDEESGFRGPGRKTDVCPQVTLEALRTFSWLPPNERPSGLGDVARAMLEVWRNRGESKPYMFGHGIGFKTIKWPTFWYDIFWFLDTIGRYPELWTKADADPSDRIAIAELVACLVAYNVGPGGQVTPRSCYRGFTSFSFGQKKRPSPFATARVAAVVKRFDDLSNDIESVDVTTLASSKGGTGSPVPPR